MAGSATRARDAAEAWMEALMRGASWGRRVERSEKGGEERRRAVASGSSGGEARSGGRRWRRSGRGSGGEILFCDEGAGAEEEVVLAWAIVRLTGAGSGVAVEMAWMRR